MKKPENGKLTLKAGGKYKVKAKVKKQKKGRKLIPEKQCRRLRYLTSNKAVATVSRAGMITAKAKGKCRVYVIAATGKSKTVKITVK